MTENTIKENTKSFLSKYINVEEIDDEEDLFASGRINSLFAMQLVLFVEKEYSVKVGQEDLTYDNFKSVNAIVNFILGKIE